MTSVTRHRVALAALGTVIEPVMFGIFIGQVGLTSPLDPAFLVLLFMFYLGPWYLAALLVRKRIGVVGIAFLFGSISGATYLVVASDDSSTAALGLGTVPVLKWGMLVVYALVVWGRAEATARRRVPPVD